VREGYSIICYVRPTGRRWFLAKESGRLPLKCSAEGCIDCVPRTRGAAERLRRSYVIACVSLGAGADILRDAVFALPTAETLGVMAEWIVPVLEITMAARDRVVSASVVQNALVNVVSAAFSETGGVCECTPLTGWCHRCRGHFRFQKRFFVQNRFTSYFPFSGGHWFRGVTDAIDVVEGRCLPPVPQGEAWLSCRCVRGGCSAA
jgi:hypothetical protein